jgi:ribulose-phosphate 3-epimerase
MISISILDSDLLNINQVLVDLKKEGITNIHLDILDTSFVPNISFGPGLINKILEFDFVFDIHLMVETPIVILDLLNLERVDTVTVHYEIKNIQETIRYIKNKNIKIGLAINPDTGIKEIPQEVSRILIMTVYPGFGNQSFIERCIKNEKIDRSKYQIGVDGGINLSTISKVSHFDYIVIGSAYFKSKDRKEFIRKINEKINK